jgi:hypothetical protein
MFSMSLVAPWLGGFQACREALSPRERIGFNDDPGQRIRTTNAHVPNAFALIRADGGPHQTHIRAPMGADFPRS